MNVEPAVHSRELQHQLQDQASAIVILENLHTLAEVVEHSAVQHVVIASMGDLWPLVRALDQLCRAPPGEDGARLRAAASGGRQVLSFKSALVLARTQAAPAQVTPDTPAFCSTRAAPPGCPRAQLTQRNIIAATLQAESWFSPALARG